MTHTLNPCDLAALDSLLCGQLTDAQSRTVEIHLETCASCRAEIDRRAVDADDWQQIREYLSDELPAGQDSQVRTAQRTEADSSPLGIVRYLTPTDDPQMLGRMGAYEVAGVIGAGGMGVVLKGFDRSLNRYVAIKVLAPHLAANGAARRRFSREAQAAAAVVHENVIAIHGVSEANGLPFLVMPYLRGRSLQKRLDERGVLSVVEILRIGHQTAAGLAAAHAQGLVHRDIKPANILLEEGIERLKITDFGLARAVDDASLTQSGVIAGTPHFMSPEQARGEPLDPRSDLFSLGSVLYALCAGHPPFRAETSYGILRRINDEPARPPREINPEVPEWLAALVMKLLAKPRNERFGTAEEIAGLLEQCLAHVQHPIQVALPAAVVELVRSQRPPRDRNRMQRTRTAWIAVAVMLLIGAATTIAVYRRQDPSPESGGDAARIAAGSPAPEVESDSPPSVESTAGWDTIANEINQLATDGQRLEEQIEQWWGNDRE